MAYAWVFWFLAVLASFAVLEGWALVHNQMTLSQAIWRLNAEWPLFQGVFCLILGGLVVHFFWTGATR